ncbi:hypothetical protein QGN29_09425 [Temperatibacter marinus]|uniref:WD40-like Beta Propeller Repeat n=1 Tax=Temperatibacter marinus TaxID=1456591 RepID=A0AA52EET9_9PROT|nr:hypothetical protein [Temperatibacter marinus]WND01773.1 hypothetical protein QGN29_09425 [Temperatibacter marinus]
MKPLYKSMLMVTVILMGATCPTSSSPKEGSDALELAIPNGPYFGQVTPGSTPQPFAPGIVSTKRWDYGGTYTHDMSEFYFLRENKETKKQEFVVFKNKNNRWYETVISRRVGQPFVAPGDQTIHLGRRYIERSDTGLSEVKSLGAPFDKYLIMRLSASAQGTYVFDQIIRNNDGGYNDAPIHVSRLIDGKRETPKQMNNEINAGKWNSHPFIAPDESYLLWDSEREGGFGGNDIYVSFRQKNGSWGKAINLGDKINTPGWDAAASVTPDGKYILFHRSVDPDGDDNVDIYWVEAAILETLRDQE